MFLSLLQMQECAGDVAVAVWVLVEVVLVVVLGSVEVVEGQDFHDQRLKITLLHFCENVVYVLQQVSLVRVFGVIINTGTVLGSNVVPLAIQGCGVDGHKVISQKLLYRQLFFVIDDLYGFCMTGVPVADVFIAGALGPAVGIADRRFQHAIELVEKLLGSPEAASGKKNRSHVNSFRITHFQ